MILTDGPKDDVSDSLPMFRLKLRTVVRAYLQRREPIWFATHFCGRQYICGGDECPMCDSQTAREHGYLPVLAEYGKKLRPSLLELSRTAWDKFDALCRLEEISRAEGYEVEISRAKVNWPLLIEPVKITSNFKAHLALPSFTVNCVAKIHGVRGMEDDETPEKWNINTAPARCFLLQQVCK